MTKHWIKGQWSGTRGVLPSFHQPIRQSPAYVAPITLGGMHWRIAKWATHRMVMAHLSAAYAAEIAFSFICASLAAGTGLLIINAAQLVLR